MIWFEGSYPFFTKFLPVLHLWVFFLKPHNCAYSETTSDDPDQGTFDEMPGQFTSKLSRS